MQTIAIKETEELLELPALRKQNQMLERVLRDKEKECVELEANVRTIENRWKSSAREPHKVTAKGILQALELKSLNEVSLNKFRMLRSVGYFRRNAMTRETITVLNNVNNPLKMERPLYPSDAVT